jgi:quinol monooxygenase YgiN
MLMAITPINECQAHPDEATALRDFLRSVIARILDAPGCRSFERLVQHDDPTRGALIEVWDRVAAHQASVSRIPPGLLQQAQSSVAVPVRGAYYHRVSDEAA